MKRQAKFTIKDTVFRDMFSRKKYLLQLYKALHPEDKSITEDDLEIVTLQAILMNGIYNDLGFLVRGNKLVILVEAQSTWSPNILIRSLMYLMNTYNDYFEKHNIHLYGSVKVDMPKPELYVIYTGEKGIYPDVLSLKDEFFPDADCCIEVKIKVIYLQGTDDIINQYIGFCRICSEQIHLHGRTLTAVKEIIRICRDKNLLRDYLEERRTEVEDIMFKLFDQNHILDIEMENIRKEARIEGRSEGRIEGRSEGRIEGAEENRNEMVQNLLRANINIDVIAKAAKLTIEQVIAIGKKAAIL